MESTRLLTYLDKDPEEIKNTVEWRSGTNTQSPEGTFTTYMRCSATNNTGAWKILSGKGHYKLLNGNGTLVMTYPPGVVEVETLTGTVWLHP